jgi:hypothetical protein
MYVDKTLRSYWKQISLFLNTAESLVPCSFGNDTEAYSEPPKSIPNPKAWFNYSKSNVHSLKTHHLRQMQY